MNGPEHYREAERLVALVDKIGPILSVPGALPVDKANRIREDFQRVTGIKATLVGGGVEIHTAPLLAAAQVHATLALAAATAAIQATQYDGDETGERSRGWSSVA